LARDVLIRVELTGDVHRRVEHLATSARAASLASFDARLGAAARAVGVATYPA
jgi:hypothetical protein